MHGMIATIGFKTLRISVSYLKEIQIYETECEPLSVALSEENRPRVLRRVLVSKRRLRKIS
jgi:hypothetical protein